MRISLVTVGDPDKQTGGYLYHRRLAEAAPRYGAAIGFVSFPEHPFPVPALFGRGVLRAAADADLVLIDSIATAFAAPWLRYVRRPLAGMLHQPPGGIDHGACRRRLQATLDRRAYRHMRVLLVASESLRARLARLHGDVRVVAPGRDVAATADPSGFDLRRGRGAALLCVANWIPRKGIVQLLDALALLPEQAATLHLVGDDRADLRYAAEVRARAERLGDRVVLHGVVSKERVAGLYQEADVFVMPSFEDPYGTVYAEAMAAGLPVVGWRAGNLPYLAEDEVEAMIVEPGDEVALARALQRLSGDPELRQRMGDAARARAETFPTWEHTATTFFSALRTLIDP